LLSDWETAALKRHAQEENAGTLHYRSGLQFDKPANVNEVPLMDLIADTVITTAASRHRASARCASRMSKSSQRRRPRRRSRQFAIAKVFRLSRDHGVDAVMYDPDPLRGGKYVLQAKRYTRPVDVAAVRDLYGLLWMKAQIEAYWQ
jgi:Restriction endonuclease